MLNLTNDSTLDAAELHPSCSHVVVNQKHVENVTSAQRPKQRLDFFTESNPSSSKENRKLYRIINFSRKGHRWWWNEATSVELVIPTSFCSVFLNNGHLD